MDMEALGGDEGESKEVNDDEDEGEHGGGGVDNEVAWDGEHEDDGGDWRDDSAGEYPGGVGLYES